MSNKIKRVYAYDYDGDLITTKFGVDPEYYKECGYQIFGKDYYDKALSKFTDITFENENLKECNLLSKQKFAKLLMVCSALKDKKITIDDIADEIEKKNNEIEEKIKKTREDNKEEKEIDKKIESLNKGKIDKDEFLKFLDFATTNLASTIKEKALDVFNKLEKKIKNTEKNLKEIKEKNEWSLWNYIDINKAKEILKEYKNKIEKIEIDNDNGLETAIDKIFYPMSALYEIFANESIEINVDLMHKIVNHKKDENCKQIINSLKDEGSLLEDMKIFKSIASDDKNGKIFKDFVKVFYRDENDYSIIGQDKNSSKRRIDRSPEILWHPTVKKFVDDAKKSGDKIKFVVIGDSVSEKNGKSEAGKDNYTFTSLYDLEEKDLENFKDLLKNKYSYNTDELKNLENIESYRNFVKDIKIELVQETRLLREIENKKEFKDKYKIGNMKDLAYNDVLSYDKDKVYKIDSVKKALNVIGEKESVNKAIEKIEKGTRRVVFKDKREGFTENDDIYKVNRNRSSLRPIRKELKKFKDLQSKYKKMKLYAELISNYTGLHNIDNYVYKHIKNNKNGKKWTNELIKGSKKKNNKLPWR